jgi:sugar fermentation stimulation protein A
LQKPPGIEHSSLFIDDSLSRFFSVYWAAVTQKNTHSLPMRFPSPLIKGTLVKKYRRFIVDVRLEDGSIVTAHCPTMGLMNGVSEPNSIVMLSDSGLETRRNKLTWELIEIGGTWIGVNSSVPLKVLIESIEEKRIPSLNNFGEAHIDATYGRGNKIDMMLQGMEHNCFINTFHVSWVENGVALFPDVPSPRMTKSVEQLSEIARQGHRAVAFFLVQRSDCSLFKPAEHEDKDFLKALLAAQSAGVEIMVYRAHITLEEITLGKSLPYSLE